MEWGMPTPYFNRTRFSYENGELTSYEHLFLEHNSNVPKVGTSQDAVLYPFLELSVLKRWRLFLAEVGVRGNIQNLGFDKYYLNGDDFTSVPSDKTIVVPALFIKLGVSLD